MARETPKRVSGNGDSKRKCPLCGRPMKVLHTSIGFDPSQHIAKQWQCDACGKQFSFG
jgi:ribosomal protein L37AE/L43A